MNELPTILRECAEKLLEAAKLLEANPVVIADEDPRVPKILEAVCASWHIRLSVLLGKGKAKPLAEARFAAFRLLQAQCPELSLTRTANLLGRTHHGTVIHGRRQAGRWMEIDPRFRARFERAEATAVSLESNRISPTP